MSPNDLRSHVENTLALIADREAQLCYQDQAPTLDVSMELLLQWEDWYRPQTRAFAWAFDAGELVALRAFHTEFLAVRAEVGLCPPPLSTFVETESWRRYRDAARVALGHLRAKLAAA